MDSNKTYNGSSWSFDQNRRFELGVRIFPDDCDDRWEKIATLVPGKSILQIKQRYEYLRKNADAINSGRIPLPDSVHIDEAEHLEEQGRKGGWSEEEHRFFLEGLEKYGRGGWRNISRNYVPSRTPAQVASHAQKYFRRLISQEKRRPSIHDINTIVQEDGSTPLEPITGKKKKVEDDTGGSSRGRWKEPAQMTAQDLENFVPPCIFESLDPNLVPTPGLPPPPPGCSSLGKMGYGFDDQAPAQMTPDDQMYLDSMDFLEPGFSDGMF